MNPFRKGRNNRSNKVFLTSGARRVHHRLRKFKVNKRAKLKESVGFIKVKNNLKSSLLNVDGLSEEALVDVKKTVLETVPDVCVILETKRRLEETGHDISIEGYNVFETRRSDLAGDKNGGGIAVYTRIADGLVFNEHKPVIDNPEHSFVNNERAWITIDSLHAKTALCGLYMGFQAVDDRHGEWNDIIYQNLRSEIRDLRQAGYRIELLGDFNGHVGNKLGQGVEGNYPSINANGHRFLNFLADTQCTHVNGVPRVSEGLWTRQRGGVSSVIDFCAISSDHLHSVKSFIVDDKGKFTSGSDHNWIFVELEDRFVQKRRLVNQQTKKPAWNFRDDFDWTDFANEVTASVNNADFESMDAETMAQYAAQILLDAGRKHVGFRQPRKKTSMESSSLPPEVVATIELKRIFESYWKVKLTELSNTAVEQRTEEQLLAVNEAEHPFLEQKRLVAALLAERRHRGRDKVLEDCQGNSVRATKCFWSYISPKIKQSTDLDAVLSQADGVLKCDPEEIRAEVEKHFVKVFQGSMETVQQDQDQSNLVPEHSSSQSFKSMSSKVTADHSYSKDPFPRLPESDGSCSIYSDPAGWMDKSFTVAEVQKSVRKLENGKSRGLDQLPNEFLKNAGHKFTVLLTILFNKIKDSGKFPSGWNKGRISLIHKRGLRELLGNYRPLTVIVSMSGLYSRVLNDRLTQVVEVHGILGEVQNGFRKNRSGADNAFILDTILWKSMSQRRKVHMAFLDISKAYDSVNRDKLWKRMSSLGFGGKFLASIKSIYTNDCVVSTVNGLQTRPVFLRRGLRQGCSLSPMLFAIYIMEMGNDITVSNEGFRVGNICVSGLLFADDLVVLARDSAGLLRLLELVKSHTDNLLLDINTEKNKSEVISQCGEEGDKWELSNAAGEVVLSLNQVIEYKYLGTQMLDTMYKTASAKQKHCIKKAHKYKGSCIFISRDGPDVVDMIVATWCNVALPAILSGCEMIPFSESAIDEIERVQAQVAKYALGLPLGAASVCAQTELGMKSFRHRLYEHQLKFYVRVLGLDKGRWVKQALLDHLSSTWRSPYMEYLFRIRSEMGMYVIPLKTKDLTDFLDSYFVSKLNLRLTELRLPWVRPVVKLKRLSYTKEGVASETIAKFRFDSAGIGNKFPRIGDNRKHLFCPVCPTMIENTVSHLSLFCPSLETIRSEKTIITFFRNLCSSKGFSDDYIFELLINGDDWNENPVQFSDFMNRGNDLKLLLDTWLTKW